MTLISNFRQQSPQDINSFERMTSFLELVDYVQRNQNHHAKEQYMAMLDDTRFD